LVVFTLLRLLFMVIHVSIDLIFVSILGYTSSSISDITFIDIFLCFVYYKDHHQQKPDGLGRPAGQMGIRGRSHKAILSSRKTHTFSQ
ncbi:hypothetical protein, partial [Klebsiella pneumoniae]|uniref:hypothetical protein n=1 Tax=Klebsiella pneumoniae TaxID=573 RepID=UPI002552D110